MLEDLSAVMADIRKDQKSLEKLTDFSVEYLNIVGDKVYFACIKEIDRCGIYCMDTDGGNLVQLGKQYVAALTACGGRLYYLDKDRDNALYTVKYTGDGIKKITGEFHRGRVRKNQSGTAAAVPDFFIPLKKKVSVYTPKPVGFRKEVI